MPNLNTARFSLTGMGTVRALKDRLEDCWVTVKDFGATGNGSTDDTAAIQAAFNYAYGAEGSPHGEANSKLNKVVFFPRGLYKISAPLQLNQVHSATLIGAGSHQSRIFWSGSAVAGEKADIYPVIECRGCWHTHMEGLTFDAGGVQNVVMSIQNFPTWADDGSDGYYRDIHVTGAAILADTGGFGVMMGASSSGAMASERTWFKCRFTDCEAHGYMLAHSNALNHEFFGCRFADCQFGIFGQGGSGSVVVNGCYFENNSDCDIRTQTNSTLVQSCHSTSPVFAHLDGFITGCTQVNASAGEFFGNWNDNSRWFPDSNPAGAWSSTDVKSAMLVGNHSTNGIVKSDGGPEAGNTPGVHLMGNKFDNASYLAGTMAFFTDGGVAWVDGTKASGAGT